MNNIIKLSIEYCFLKTYAHHMFRQVELSNCVNSKIRFKVAFGNLLVGVALSRPIRIKESFLPLSNQTLLYEYIFKRSVANSLKTSTMTHLGNPYS